MNRDEDGNPDPFEWKWGGEEHQSKSEPWWNDGDKVGGLVATMFVLTVAIIICLGSISLAIKLFF